MHGKILDYDNNYEIYQSIFLSKLNHVKNVSMYTFPFERKWINNSCKKTTLIWM